MLISHTKKFIFIHNYKVAGTSIRTGLRNYNSKSPIKSSLGTKLGMLTGKYPKIFSSQFDGHIRAKELKAKLPDEVFESYFKFGFVRNPWDWQVSLYEFMLKDTDHYQHEFIKNLGSFEKYLSWRIEKELRFQKDFFYDGDQLLVDYVGKLETLNEDMKVIAEKLNIEIEVPHLKKSRDNKKFLHYYTPESVALVAEAFKKDIEAFGYSVPEI